MFKSYVVVGDAANRDLGSIVDKSVNSFLSSDNGGTLESLQIQADLQAGGFGKAFVTVFFTPKVKSSGKKK